MTICLFFYGGVTWYTAEAGAESMSKYYLFD